MSREFEIMLGQSTNLLKGFQKDIYSVPFANSSKPALFQHEAVIKNPGDNAKWSYPVITLHENAEDLLSAVLQVKLRPMRNEEQPSEGGSPSSWPSGALMLAGMDKVARQKALKHLSAQLDVDLSTAGWSYALARCTRKVGMATHLCYERGIFGNPDPDSTIRPDALAALKKLEKLQKTSTDVTMDGAKGYLDFYENYGTHFVSSITAGDSIFQVFAYDASAFKEIQKTYKTDPESFGGPLSYSFTIFTVPRSDDGKFGYTAAAGKICIASEDEELVKSLHDGLWCDESYSGTNSVLTPYHYGRSNYLNTTFKKVVLISFELASLSIFAEYYRMLIWHRVFKGVMFTKYANGFGVAPYFSNNCPYDLNTIFKDSDPIDGDGLLSTLSTPSVNIMKEKIDLDAFVVRFPEVVREFAIFANAIQLPNSNHKQKTSINVPGSSRVTFLGHVISCGGNSPLPPNIQITDSAFKDIEGRLFCGEFYGGLRISNSDDSKSCVVMNGLMMKYNDRKVTIIRDVRESPSSKIVMERLTDIQFSLVVAEARLNFLLANSTNHDKSIELMKRFLVWLADVTGSEDQLLDLKARAMYLAKVAGSPQQSGIPVPLLRYEAYKDVVKNVQNVIKTASEKLLNFQSQIRARMAEEREIKREQALNENIIKSGKLLQEYISTQADYQSSLESMFQSVFEDKEDEMNNVAKETKKLESGLNKQRTVVDEAIMDYQDAVADWEKQETLKAVMDIASGLFSLGFAFVTPSSSFTALQSLGNAVQKIQKMAKVFDAVINVYKSFKKLPKDPQRVVEALKDLGPEGLVTLSTLEWDEMHVNFKAVISTGPDISAKTKLSAAFEILVLRGKALLESQSSIQKIAADLSAVQQRIKLHQDQKKRLDELKINLDAKPQKLDLEKIDLIGISGQLLFFQRQMLMILASTVVIQDRALQYEYLRQPTPIGSFTMMGLQLAIFRQSQSINQGLTVQPLPQKQKDPIIYEIHGVRPETITNNRRFAFNIDINKCEFVSFNYVRVESVMVEIDGIVSTDSGKYYTELVFDGDPFYDRSFDGETLTFQTTSRIFTGL
ncbi:uncharacterized protein LOC114535155 [Dendronephthya gigantea]|uniref:uncharacterized protein LOC114535155 n=1 Tax=Dendronephthya gigantea TaxID=151771 RepID=UPI00106DC0FC|nr:uncharacterized protein LOC114535155 [Dendronephthya gigantea]XP_028412349.1 uncharacterized protein LOC114535155 [Dendronephthya gigantea]